MKKTVKALNIGNGKWRIVLIYEDDSVSAYLQKTNAKDKMHIYTANVELRQISNSIMAILNNSKNGVIQYSVYVGNEIRDTSMEYWIWLWCQQREFCRLYDECLRTVHMYYSVDKKSFMSIRMLLEECIADKILEMIKRCVKIHNSSIPTRTA